MAQPTTAGWQHLVIMMEDPQTAGSYIMPGVLITKTFDITATTSSVSVPDDTNPDLPAWVVHALRDQSHALSGSAQWTVEHFALWRTWAVSGGARNIRTMVDLPLAQGGGYFQGAYLLTRFGLSASRTGEPIITIPNITLQGSGPITWTPAAS